MIELPEAAALAAQARERLSGRTVTAAEAHRTPHRLMWFSGDPATYRDLLTGAVITGAQGIAGHVQLEAGDLRIVLSDGAYPRWFAPGEPVPDRHQLRLDLDDGGTLVVVVAMYGGIQVFHDGENDNPYYLAAVQAPSPLGPDADAAWFTGLLDGSDRLPAKAFLATEQRIPGLGNGVLLDILWTARVHPRRRVGTLGAAGDSGSMAAGAAIDQGHQRVSRSALSRASCASTPS